ncbi:hypothetical protein ACFVS2_09645 [Brevibacillus sp. NPDC058079]|uniref:hypothetical protein n=1 Tax=Brevibacillus sp. NPDC058079 TaxID=3346330 RepID=UPI0036E39BF6
MHYPLVVAVIKEPYYQIPDWLNTDVAYTEYVKLTGQTTSDEVDLFIAMLLGYNNIDIKGTPHEVLKRLFDELDVVIGGGIYLESNDRIIPPSCCSGLEAWRDVLDSVINRKSPWMGHNPTPRMEFADNIVRVWSDDSNEEDVDKNELYYIDFDYVEFIAKLEMIESDLMEFARVPLFNRFLEFDLELANDVVKRFESWFIFKGD